MIFTDFSTSHMTKPTLRFECFQITDYIGPYSEKLGPSNWTAASTTCTNLGMRLMTIDSREEESRVVQNLSVTNEYVKESKIK